MYGVGQNIKWHPVWDVRFDFWSSECFDGSEQTDRQRVSDVTIH